MSEWYQMTADEAVAELHTDAKQGLSAAEAERRLAEYGPNELIERGREESVADLLGAIDRDPRARADRGGGRFSDPWRL